MLYFQVILIPLFSNSYDRLLGTFNALNYVQNLAEVEENTFNSSVSNNGICLKIEQCRLGTVPPPHGKFSLDKNLHASFDSKSGTALVHGAPTVGDCPNSQTH